MKRRIMAAVAIGVLATGVLVTPAHAGLTQWLISHGVYDPDAPGGKPVQEPVPISEGCGG